MKKISIFLSCFAIVAIVMTSFGALAMTEQQFVSALKAKGLGTEYITQAESIMKSYDFTSAELDGIMTKTNTLIADITAIQPEALKSPSNIDTSKLTSDQKATIVGDVIAVANAAGFTAVPTVDAKGNFALAIKDPDGKNIGIINAEKAKLNATGFGTENSTVLVISIVLASLLAVSGIAIAKKIRTA